MDESTDARRSLRDGGATSRGHPRGGAATVFDRRHNVDALQTRLRGAGIAVGVAHDLVRRYPAEQIADALHVLPTRRTADAVGWLVRAISEAWDLRPEADAVRSAGARRQRERARAVEAIRREREHDQRLAGWAAAISDALTDQQLADAVELVAKPIGWLGRLAAPLATTHLLAWPPTPPPAHPNSRSVQSSMRHSRHRP